MALVGYTTFLISGKNLTNRIPSPGHETYRIFFVSDVGKVILRISGQLDRRGQIPGFESGGYRLAFFVRYIPHRVTNPVENILRDFRLREYGIA
ncbi:hypothetical protein Holit_02463 [Hollandina sp. SP2]